MQKFKSMFLGVSMLAALATMSYSQMASAEDAPACVQTISEVNDQLANQIDRGVAIDNELLSVEDSKAFLKSLAEYAPDSNADAERTNRILLASFQGETMVMLADKDSCVFGVGRIPTLIVNEIRGKKPA